MALINTSESVLGYKDPKRKDWITDTTWREIQARREIRSKLNRETENKKKRLQQNYQEKNRIFRKSCKRDKKAQVDEMAKEAEAAARKRHLYRITRQLSGKNRIPSRPVSDIQGTLLTKESQQLERLKEHFEKVLNRPPPDSFPSIGEERKDLNINCGRISKEEIKRASKKLKLGRVPGKDNILPNVLKADINATTDVLHGLLNDIWVKEGYPMSGKKA